MHVFFLGATQLRASAFLIHIHGKRGTAILKDIYDRHLQPGFQEC